MRVALVGMWVCHWRRSYSPQPMSMQDVILGLNFKPHTTGFWAKTFQGHSRSDNWLPLWAYFLCSPFLQIFCSSYSDYLLLLKLIKHIFTSGLRPLLFSLSLPIVKAAQSCPTLCDPMDYTVHGILQVRILEWLAFPFSRGSSQPRDRTQASCIAGRFFTSWATTEAPFHRDITIIIFSFLQIHAYLFSV